MNGFMGGINCAHFQWFFNKQNKIPIKFRIIMKNAGYSRIH